MNGVCRNSANTTSDEMGMRMGSTAEPRFSFIMIVLNGMPFVEYALQAIYPGAHEIIVVEGAIELCRFAANPDGSSTDGTAETIRNFPDPEGKIRLIQGVWPEKLDMHNRALDFVTGNYVWLVDADEIYPRSDIERVRSLLREDPAIVRVDFIPDNFWKGFDYIFVSDQFSRPDCHYRRVFRYRHGDRFVSHRPPTLSAELGRIVGGEETRRLTIFPRHYSYVHWSQVYQKIELYHRYGWDKQWDVDLDEWYREFYCQWTPENRGELEGRYPVWTGDPASRTRPFVGTHPEVMLDLVRSWDNEASGGLAAVDEAGTRSIIGDAFFQRRVLKAWEYLELDAPLLKRRDLLLKHVTTNSTNFWNIHVALAFLALTLHPRNYLEVGTRTGGSLVQVLHHAPLKRVVSVDLWSGNYAGMTNTVAFTEKQFSRYQETTGNRAALRFVRGDSHRELKRLIDRRERFDLITIDGDHTRDGAWEDLEDAVRLLSPRGAIVFDDIIHPAHRDLFTLCHRLRLKYPQFRVLLNTGQDNGCAIFLRGVDHEELLAKARKLAASNMHVAGEEHPPPGDNLASIGQNSSFSRGIMDLIARVKPSRIIETGTFHGQGTTWIIAEALCRQGLDDARFFTIECNADNLSRARENLSRSGLLARVELVHGLSVPRRLLPSADVIRERLIDTIGDEDLYVDHDAGVRSQRYFAETDFHDIPDDRLKHCLDLCGGRPDFVLLDSGGHMGNVEFNYLLEHLAAPCYIALDDIHHVKHRRSFKQICKDPRFRLEVAAPEKFGYCIAHFTPTAAGGAAAPKRLLWIRTDAIGDSVISLPVLSRIRDTYPHAWISVLCQEQVAEIYGACSFVDEVQTFDRGRAQEDPDYRQTMVRILQSLRADLCLVPVFSREELTDQFALGSKAAERIAFDGDACNLDPARHQWHNRSYTGLVATAERGLRSEHRRYELFLEALQIPAGQIAPQAYLAPADVAFAEEFLARDGLAPDRTIAFFAGAKDGHRLSQAYGSALEQFCAEGGYAVVAFGQEKDRAIVRGNVAGRGFRVVDLCGKTTVGQAAAIIARSALAFGAETGLAHLAVAAGTRNVVLLGGGQFGRFMPSAASTTAVVLPLECFGCKWQCCYAEPYCVKGVVSEALLAGLRLAVSSPGGRPRLVLLGRSFWPVQKGLPRWDDAVVSRVDFPVDVTVLEADGASRQYELPGAGENDLPAARLLTPSQPEQDIQALLTYYWLDSEVSTMRRLATAWRLRHLTGQGLADMLHDNFAYLKRRLREGR